jgi:hypothetical protein
MGIGMEGGRILVGGGVMIGGRNMERAAHGTLLELEAPVDVAGVVGTWLGGRITGIVKGTRMIRGK